MKKLYTAFALLLLSASAWAGENEGMPPKFPAPLDNLRPLVLEAIESPSGTAWGILGGDAAKFIYNQTAATTPLRVTVTRLIKYNQPGCARLNAQFQQDDVRIPMEKTAKNREVNFQFNYCLDGRAPKTEGKEFVQESMRQRAFWDKRLPQ